MRTIPSIKILSRLLTLGENLLFLYRGRFRPVKKRFGKRLRRLIPWILAVGTSGLLAWGIVNVPPEKVISVVLGVLLAVLFTRHIEFGIAAVMVAVASIIYPNAIPKPFTLGGLGPTVGELLIAILVLVVIIRQIVEKRLLLFSTPITTPLLLLCASAILSMIVSYERHIQNLGEPYDFSNVYNAARPMFYYLLFFAVAFGIRTEHSLNRLLRMLIWTTIVVSVMMVAESFLSPMGKTVFIGGRVAKYLYTLQEEQDVVRSLPPGIAPVIIFFLITMTQAAYRGVRKSFHLGLAALVLGIGLIFTFFRSYWIASFLSLVIVWLFSNAVVKRRLLTLAVIVAVITVFGSVTITTYAPGSAAGRFVIALEERFVSIFDIEKTLRSKSLQNRIQENADAIQQIKRHYIFGIGAGNPIRYKVYSHPLTGAQSIYPQTGIHSAYLELWVVYGLLGIVAFSWLSIAFLARSLILFLRVRDPAMKALAIAMFAGYIGFLQRSVTQAHITRDIHQIVTVAVVWGIVEVMWRLHITERNTRIDAGYSSDIKKEVAQV